MHKHLRIPQGAYFDKLWALHLNTIQCVNLSSTTVQEKQMVMDKSILGGENIDRWFVKPETPLAKVWLWLSVLGT